MRLALKVLGAVLVGFTLGTLCGLGVGVAGLPILAVAVVSFIVSGATTLMLTAIAIESE